MGADYKSGAHGCGLQIRGSWVRIANPHQQLITNPHQQLISNPHQFANPRREVFGRFLPCIEGFTLIGYQFGYFAYSCSVQTKTTL